MSNDNEPRSPFTHSLHMISGSVDYPHASHVYLNVDTQARAITVYRQGPPVSTGFPEMEVRRYSNGYTALIPTGSNKTDLIDPPPLKTKGTVTLSRMPGPDEDEDNVLGLLVNTHDYDGSNGAAPAFVVVITDEGRVNLLDGGVYRYLGLEQTPYRAEPPIEGGRYDPNGPTG